MIALSGGLVLLAFALLLAGLAAQGDAGLRLVELSILASVVSAVLLLAGVVLRRRPPLAHPPAGAPGPVFVVDGQPHYHASGCPRADPGAAEPVALAEARESGFGPCPACVPGAGADLVVVAGARGRFHRPGCRYVRDLPEARETSRDEASAAGYGPCRVCRS